VTVAAGRRARARRGEGERLREEVLGAARELLAETGSEEAVSIRAVAARVGVSTPSIYLHFPDKQALIDAVCEQVFAALDQRMEAAAAEADSPFEALRRSGMAYIQFGIENPEHYRIVFLARSEQDRSADRQVASDVFQHLVARIQACVDVGILVGEPFVLGMTLWAGAHGLTSLLVTKPHWPWPDVSELADRVVRTSGLGLALYSRLDPVASQPDADPDEVADAVQEAGRAMAETLRRLG
jgi:AcrR family transcriptional regulator